MSFHSRSVLVPPSARREGKTGRAGRTILERGETFKGNLELVLVRKPARVVFNGDVGCRQGEQASEAWSVFCSGQGGRRRSGTEAARRR